MEFNCPTCQTKLRVSDELQNPKVRCRACGTIFRPLESGGSISPSPTPPVAPQVNRFPDQPKPAESPFASTSQPGRDSFGSPTPSAPTRPRPVVTPRSAAPGKRGGWGIILFIILMLLSRGPRLLRNFQRQPAPPPPVQIDDDEVLRRLREVQERAKLKEADDLPELPNVVNPVDLQLNGEAPDPIENAP